MESVVIFVCVNASAVLRYSSAYDMSLKTEFVRSNINYI
jgi:hypothetical protein